MDGTRHNNGWTYTIGMIVNLRQCERSVIVLDRDLTRVVRPNHAVEDERGLILVTQSLSTDCKVSFEACTDVEGESKT